MNDGYHDEALKLIKDKMKELGMDYDVEPQMGSIP